MSSDILVQPHISSDDTIYIKIRNHLIKDYNVTIKNISYRHEIVESDIVYVISNYSSSRKDNYIKELKEIIKCVKCNDGLFYQVYAEIAFITHLLYEHNREKRGKCKNISTLIKQAIKIYRDVSPSKYTVFDQYDSTYDKKVFYLYFSILLIAIIILLCAVLVLIAFKPLY